jgi:hypothetical protein
LFALKHEGVRLDLLAAALRRLPPDELAAWVRATPNSVYGRKLGCLWERWHHQRLPGLPDVGVASSYAPLFDPELYFVGPAQRDARWRIEFNGLGDLDFCPVVRKTPALKALVQKDILGQAKAFADEVGPALLERAMTWAYLSETEGSFAIEGEAPSHDKATLFAGLLRRAHEQRALTEELLVELQNAAISNPLDKAVQFRTEQNRLQRDVPGAAGVSYVPPEPALAVALMQELYRALVNDQAHRFAELFEHLLASDTPLVFHCTAGKDRTGFAAALILHALGVPREAVVQDYLLTNNHERMVARLPVMREHVTQASGGREPSDEALLTAMRVEAEYLEEAFRVMRRDHGSLDGYLDQALGLTPALRERIHDRLLA